jgi:hypothetical protein
MRFRVYMTSGSLDGDIVVAGLKNRWLHVVGSYDSSRNYTFSITDTTTGITTTVTKTGSYNLKSVSSGDITFGSTSPSTGGKPTNRNFRGMVDEMKISNKVVTPHYAFNPVPTSGSTIYVQPEVLLWSKGLAAQGSNVFFGTSSSAVAAATAPLFDIDGSRFVDFRDFAFLGGQWGRAPVYPWADIDRTGVVDGADLFLLADKWLTDTSVAYPLFVGGTAGNTVECPSLLPSTSYYWRVDSLENPATTVPGNLWSFTTGSARASNPAPASGTAEVAADSNTVTLGWVPAFGAAWYNVYFGTHANPPFYGTAATPSLPVSGLAPRTKYYWRVDSVGPFGVTGTVWDFTTGAIGAISPSPADQAASVAFPLGGVDLSWTSTFKPDSYNVYFGTQNPPPYVGTTSAETFRSPDVVQNKTYYWRIDCVSVFGTTTGTVWSFVTATPAFPQAEGFGRFAKGGRNGDVYHVTTLADSSTPTNGMLRYGINNAPSAGRTIVFDVGGYINLASRLSITKNNITIAGQTAPGGGIGISGAGVSIGAKDLIMRYVRFRYTSTASDDCITVNSNCSNAIFDHVSASWGIDEVFSVTSSQNVTIQWCMITEGLNCEGHSKGSLLEWPVLSLHHSLYAHNDDRNPKNKGVFDYRNNVVYNWGMAPYIAGGGTGGQCYANCVGNYYIAGADTDVPDYMVVGGNSNYHIYFSDNRLDSNRNGIKDGLDLGTAMMDPAAMPVVMPTPYEYPPVATTSPETAYMQVLSYAGCSLVRDEIDTRIVNDVINETGWIITYYTDRGGLGAIPGGMPPADTDQDGMPDAWEDAHGLDKTSAADGGLDPDGDGYTNLEDYLNSLAVYP